MGDFRMTKIGFLVVGLLLTSSCTGGDGGPSNREICKGIAEAALDMALRCDKLDLGLGGDELSPGQFQAYVENAACCINEDCVGPDDASSSAVESCETAILFQECAAEGLGFPSECQGIGALFTPPPPE